MSTLADYPQLKYYQAHRNERVPIKIQTFSYLPMWSQLVVADYHRKPTFRKNLNTYRKVSDFMLDILNIDSLREEQQVNPVITAYRLLTAVVSAITAEHIDQNVQEFQYDMTVFEYNTELLTTGKVTIVNTTFTLQEIMTETLDVFESVIEQLTTD